MIAAIIFFIIETPTRVGAFHIGSEPVPRMNKAYNSLSSNLDLAPYAGQGSTMRSLLDARTAATEFDRWARYLLDSPDDEWIQHHVEDLTPALNRCADKDGPGEPGACRSACGKWIETRDAGDRSLCMSRAPS